MNRTIRGAAFDDGGARGAALARRIRAVGGPADHAGTAGGADRGAAILR